MSDWADPHADNLLVRAASGVVLGVGGVGAALAGGAWLSAATAAAVTAMAYEWARMSEPNAPTPAFLMILAGGLGGVLAFAAGHKSLALGLVLAGGVGGFLRRGGGVIGRSEAAFGALYIGLPCLGLLWLREAPAFGALGVIALFTLVWSTDIAAYTGGRLIGGPRLAPSLSPRKTWAGLGAGAMAAAGAGAVLAAILHGPWLIWTMTGLVIGLAALGGDLFESLCKRRFGVKDASGLIPGHGGVMDRLDGLMVAVPLSAGVVWAAPGFIAMLFGGVR